MDDITYICKYYSLPYYIDIVNDSMAVCLRYPFEYEGNVFNLFIEDFHSMVFFPTYGWDTLQGRILYTLSMTLEKYKEIEKDM